jgi:heat shock protein HslJ
MKYFLSLVLLGILMIVPLAGVSAQDATEEAANSEIIGVEWQWQDFQSSDDAIGTTTVPNPANYTLTLNDDGTYNFRADCNVGGGMYTLDGESLTLLPGFMTMAMCPPESLSNDFLQHLASVVTFVLADGDLHLNLAMDSGNMRFSPATSEIIGVQWLWQDFQSSDDAIGTITVPNPENYSLTLHDDGTYSIQADCNVGGGTYTLDGESLTLVPGILTMAMCPEESLSNDFLQHLAAVVTFVVQDGDLHLNLMADAGNMRFSPAPVQLVGVEWQWQDFQSSDDAIGTTTIANPENFTLKLNDDGTYNFRADCNVGSGMYTLDGESLTLLPGFTTLAFCPDQMLADAYLQHLASVATFVIQDGDLHLNLAMDAGNMRFSPAP